MSESRAALQPARPGGKRRLTFDNGRYEDYQAVFVQHSGGEWDRILIARDDGSIARLIADLINGAATPEPTLDAERLAEALIEAQRLNREPIRLTDKSEALLLAEWLLARLHERTEPHE